LISTGIVAVFGTILATFFSRTISKPIMKLKKSVNTLSQGKSVKKMDISSNDEIGDLAKNFFEMSNELKLSRKKLETYNKNLEDQVNIRTKELADKIREINAQKRKAEMYLDVAGNIILALDKQGRVTLMNSKGYYILGYKDRELVGRNWFDTCIPKEKIKKIKGVFYKIISNEIKEADQFKEFENEGGKKRW